MTTQTSTKIATLATLDNTLAILDNEELTQQQFLIAVSVSAKSDQAKLVIAKALNNNCEQILAWLNEDANTTLLNAVKNHIQRISGRYASKTHTIAEQGGVYSYVARTREDIEAFEKAELVEFLVKANFKATKKHDLQALLQAKNLQALLVKNEVVLQEINYQFDRDALDLSKFEIVKAAFDTVASTINTAVQNRKQLLADQKKFKLELSLILVEKADEVQVGLVDKLRQLPITTTSEVKEALQFIDCVNQLIKHKVKCSPKEKNLGDFQNALRDALDMKLVQAEANQDILEHKLVLKNATVNALQNEVQAVVTEKEQLKEVVEAVVTEKEQLKEQSKIVALENHKLKNENVNLKEQVTVNDSLDFKLSKDDLELSSHLSKAMDTVVNAWLLKNDSATNANARLVAAKILYDKAIMLLALSAQAAPKDEAI